MQVSNGDKMDVIERVNHQFHLKAGFPNRCVNAERDYDGITLMS